MSNSPTNPLARSADLGREVTPRTEPVPAPPAVPSTGPQFRQPRELPPSTRPNLLPFAREISAGLGDSMTLSRLNDAVLLGQLSKDEANQIAHALGLDR